jgi:hAT family C-terminal dimerisation region
LESDLFKARGLSDLEPEYTKWMKQLPVRRDTNILKYWTSKEYEFPTIARMARDHLAIPATSAASECVFSVGGDIITKKRNRLGAGNTRRLLCLRDWEVLVEGQDGADGSDVEIDPDEVDAWD